MQYLKFSFKNFAAFIPLRFFIGFCVISLSACDSEISQAPASVQEKPIDREALVQRHNPQLNAIDWNSPFTVGNGQFAFTADITGLQSFADAYFENGTPLETKARWAWHSRPNPEGFRLVDANELYQTYGDQSIAFPTNMDSKAGQWLRKNPHDLPLARLGFIYEGRELNAELVDGVHQNLNLWRGLLESQFSLSNSEVKVATSVAGSRDAIGVRVQSELLASKELALRIAFPRGYELGVKNTPNLLWSHDEHSSTIIAQSDNHALFERQVDDAKHWLRVHWTGSAELKTLDAHEYHLVLSQQADEVELVLEFSKATKPEALMSFNELVLDAESAWEKYWRSGAAIDFSGSQSPQAHELERRVVLSQYLMGVQGRANIPAQETGLTSSSWYGKFHTEMSWWHNAHWALWHRQEPLVKVLDWYVEHLPAARETAKLRNLQGARWSKMVGPDGRESPGGNPLIIWNQPQPIELAERLYQSKPSPEVLARYAGLVEESAEALSSMLVWEEDTQRYSLFPPIWIAQEHYDVKESKNPSFELGFWRVGLQLAQQWRLRLGKEPNPFWQKQIDSLAELPQKDKKYVAIETIPDTFDNIDSRNDHPAMLGTWGMFADDRVDLEVMRNTLDAVMSDWDFETRIWGWDYPMIAMTANKLGQAQRAVDALLMDAHNNHYMVNGHVPQKKVGLPVYLPANGALLAAVAQMALSNSREAARGFPNDGLWQVKVEGF